MNAKKMLGKVVAKIVKNAAISASNSTSFLGYYQPKEPEALKKLKK